MKLLRVVEFIEDKFLNGKFEKKLIIIILIIVNNVLILMFGICYVSFLRGLCISM